MSANWEKLAAVKRQERQNAIPQAWVLAEAATPPSEQKNVLDVPRTCGLLTARELEITETVDIAALLRKLASGQWSSMEVTRAYYKRAIVAQQLVNCLTEIFVGRALERAKELDEQLKATGKPVGPLHGLPISLKDQFSIEGLDTTMGYTQWIGKPASRNCTLVDLLLEAGAVPFVRTNVPQTLMWPETVNHVRKDEFAEKLWTLLQQTAFLECAAVEVLSADGAAYQWSAGSAALPSALELPGSAPWLF